MKLPAFLLVTIIIFGSLSESDAAPQAAAPQDAARRNFSVSTTQKPSQEPVTRWNATVRRQSRQRQVDEILPGEDADFCDFGTNENVNLCNWTNLNLTDLRWRPSRGLNAFWYGGPIVDISFEDDQGGYAIFETSAVSSGPAFHGFESAMLISPVMTRTEARGTCLNFWFAISGLSPNRLRVILHPVKDARELDPAFQAPRGYDASEDVVLWEFRDVTFDDWREGQVSYSYTDNHTIIFEAVPVERNDLSRMYRGYIAIDNVDFAEAKTCGPFCNFEGGFCGWSNDEEDDDFDWELSRGSQNPSTGPPRDRSSFGHPSRGVGAYAYINSGYPRRPGDRARLMSEEYSATESDNPLCMRFWAHMYGNGIGALRVIVFYVDETDPLKKDRVIWEVAREAGNEWYQGQVPITATEPFKIVFEGEVGQNDLGDIGLDEIAILQGACPGAPQAASKSNTDCTFELDECSWQNPLDRDRLDETEWKRTLASESRAPSVDHTKGTKDGFFMSLPQDSIQRRGDRAWFLSPVMNVSTNSQFMCLSFWYFMYEPLIDNSGPSLGALSVFLYRENDTREDDFKQLWGLKNHQGPNWMYAQVPVQSDINYRIVIEGALGNSQFKGYIAIDDITFFKGRCTTKPQKALSLTGDCDFQRGSCQWANSTTDPDFRWSAATISRRPTGLLDHTYGGPSGFVYFDVFNQNGRAQTLELVSPLMMAVEVAGGSRAESKVCFSFWYALFGSGFSTRLQVKSVVGADDDNTEGDVIWQITAETLSQFRPDWNFSQVELDASRDQKIVFVGMASNGGYAVDDIRSYPGECNIRPREAHPDSPENNPSRTSDNAV